MLTIARRAPPGS